MTETPSTTTLSELARAALLGAERESVPIPAPDSPLAPFWVQLQELAPEYQLLSMAGVGSLYQKAGSLPARVVIQRVSSTPSELQEADVGSSGPTNEEAQSASSSRGPIPTDNLHPTPCSTEAGQLLVALFDGTHRTLVPEFLQMMAVARLTVPNEYLPNILTYGVNQPSLRQTILAVTGEKGRALAALNAKWAYASPQQLSWEAALHRWRTTKTSAGRQSFLRQLRSHDAVLALRLLETTWRSEESAARVSLMRGIEMGLTMADEPFLEAALDDRNNSVRKKAVDLLSAMPASRLSQRMAKNTAELLEWVDESVESKQSVSKQSVSEKKQSKKSKSEKKAKIVVHFPDEISAEMQRDGVLRRNIKDESRRRRMELLDMVTPVPLDTWTERWQVTPAEVVRAVQGSRWPRTLTQALVQATERQQHTTIAAAWVDALLAHAEFKLPVTKLIGLLSPEKFDALIERIDLGVDENNPLDKKHPLVVTVRRWTPIWSEALSLRWLEQLEAQMLLDAETTSLDSLVRTATKQFASKCTPSIIEQAIKRLVIINVTCPDVWKPTLEQSLATLRMRRKMRDVL